MWVSLVAVAVLATDGTHAQGLGGAGGGPAPGSPVPPTSRERSSPAEPGPSPRNIVVDLSPRLVPGEVTTWRMTTTSRNQAEGGAMGLPTASDLTQEITIRAEVLQTEDGSRLAELTFQRVKIRYEAEGIRIEADSATRPSPAPAPRPQRPADDLDRLIDEQARRLQGVMDTAVRQLASTRLRVRFTASGEVEAVEGGEALGVAGPLGALGLAGGVTGAQEATNVFGPIVVRQPGTGGATVRVGERWTTISDLQLQPLGGVRLRSDYELRSVKGTRALVSMRSNLDPSTEAPDAPMQVRSIRRVGTFTWDAEHRRLESMDSELELHVGAGTAAGMPELRSRAVTRLERLAEERPR